MCGIYGHLSKNSISHDTFKQCLSTLTKRGPDSEGIEFYKNENTTIAFGFRRLAIIDTSSKGNQPMVDTSERYSIIFNGEIFNYQQLREDLVKKGYKFQSKSDTEVVLLGYKEYGLKVVEKIKGMFAFAIYDKQKQIVSLARDHFGKKPLYYYLDDKNFIFGSELKSILNNKDIKEKLHVDNHSVIKFLMYGYVPSPHTIFEEVSKLEPSTLLQFNIKNWKVIKKLKYWKLENIQVDKLVTFSQAVENVDQLLHTSIKQRLIADVPLGSFLSGGVDSSLVTAIASQYKPGIETFSVVYNEKKFDESEYAKKVGDSLNIKYNFFNFKDTNALPLLEEILDYMDEPMADASLLPTTFVAKNTSKKVTVSLSGDGGDELFGGYAKYNAQLVANKLQALGLSKFVHFTSKGLKYLPIDKTILEGLHKAAVSIKYDTAVRHFVLGSGSFSIDELQHLITDKKLLSLAQIFEDSYYYAQTFTQKDKGNLLLYLDAKIQLPDWYLVKVDRASMSQSLEVRSPLLDKDLTEYVFTLPSEYKFNSRDTKILLKKVAEKYLPTDVIYRKKMGFGLPLSRWMRHNFRTAIEESLQDLKTDILDKKYVLQLWEEFVSEKNDHGTKLWRIFILNTFLKKYA